MAVISAVEIGPRRTTRAIDGRSHTTIWLAKTDSAADTSHTVSLDARFNGIGTETFPTDPLAYLAEVTPEPVRDDPKRWLVTKLYRTLRGPYSDRHRVANPLLRAPEIEYDCIVGSRAVLRDLSGAAVVNSAGVPFTPGLEIPVVTPVMRITRNQPTFSPTVLRDYVETCNDATWYGLDAGQALMAHISARQVIEVTTDYSAPYWQVTYEIHVAPLLSTAPTVTYDDWSNVKLVQAGFQEKYTESGASKLRPCADASGMPFATAQLLTAQGAMAPVGTTPVYVDFQVRRARTFGPGGLDL